jgi:hypothetical protein
MVEACERIERFVRAADQSRYFTTFAGATPELPQASADAPAYDRRIPRRLGTAGRLPVRNATGFRDAERPSFKRPGGLTVRHAASGPLVYSPEDQGVTHARQVTAGIVSFELAETIGRSDSTAEWLLTARSAVAIEGWAVVFVRDGTDADAPYLQYVIPLVATPQTREAVGSLFMGSATQALAWYAAEQTVQDVHLVANKTALERSLARSGSSAVARALETALAEEGPDSNRRR